MATITAAHNNSQHSPGFDITVTGLSGFDKLTIVRVDTNGEYPDTPVRGADNVPIIGSAFAVTDFEAPVGRAVIYRMTATASIVFDSFTRTVTSSWGATPSGQQWTMVTTTPASDFAVNGAQGTQTLGTRGQIRMMELDVDIQELNMLLDIRPSVVASGDQFVGAIHTNRTDWNNYYSWEVMFLPGGTMNIRLLKNSGGVSSTLATVAGVTYSGGSWLHVRIKSLNGVMQMRIWGGAEPDVWGIDTVDLAPLPSGAVGLGSIVYPTNTNTLPVVVSYDALSIAGLENQTVASTTAETPSVNSSMTYLPGATWLKSVGQPALSRRVNLSQWPGSSRPGRVLGEYEVLGRRNKVVNVDVLGGREETIVFATFKVGSGWENDSSYRDLMALLEYGGVLLLQSTGVDDTGESDLYFQIRDLKITRVGVVGGDFANLFEVQFIEVDPPATDEESLTLRSWQDVLDQNINWNTVRLRHPTWLDLLQRDNEIGIS